MTVEQPPVVLSGWAFAWTAWLYLLAAALVGGMLVLVLPLPWSLLVTAAGVALLTYPALRARRVSLAIGPDSVRVVNFLRTYELFWAEIASIELSGGSSLEEGASRGIWLKLRDGRRILCQASTGYVPWAGVALDALRPYATRWGVPISGEST